MTGALHWGEQGFLAFGAHNAVMIYHPEVRWDAAEAAPHLYGAHPNATAPPRVAHRHCFAQMLTASDPCAHIPSLQEARLLGTLLGHNDRVNCVRWLPACALRPGQPAALASGASDGSVRIWQWTPGTPGQPWRLTAVLQAHAAPVTSLAVLPLPAGGMLLVSTAGDGEAAVWESSPLRPCDNSSRVDSTGSAAGAAAAAAAVPPEQDTWRLRQRIALGHSLPGCAALAPLPADPGWLLLALGGVDSAVRLFLCPPGEGGLFEPVCQLAGHQDWIKGLAFAQMDGEPGAGLAGSRGPPMRDVRRVRRGNKAWTHSPDASCRWPGCCVATLCA